MPAQKKTVCPCGHEQSGWYDQRIRLVRDLDCGGKAMYLEVAIRRINCRRCNEVKTETLEWLLTSGRFTKRFEEKVGRMARQMPLTEVAELNQISWDQAWRMELSYMKDLLS